MLAVAVVKHWPEVLGGGSSILGWVLCPPTPWQVGGLSEDHIS